MEKVTDGVFQAGTSRVNWYVVEDGGRFTVVDAGLPGYRPQLDEALSELGARLRDVEAVILTHGHRDHIGFAGKLQEERGTPVYIHEADAETTRTGDLPRGERGIRPYLHRPGLWSTLIHGGRNGAMPAPSVAELSTFDGGGDVLDVPGRPRVIHAPGHSPGSCAFHFEDRDALVVGDVLCTWNPITGREGPQILPGFFTADSRQALGSLRAIEAVDAGTLASGHGPPWRGGTREAVAAAREAGPT